MAAGEFMSRDADNNETGMVGSSYMGLTVGYATKLDFANIQSLNMNAVNLGANIKMFNQSLFGNSSIVFGLDLAGQVKLLNQKQLSAGLVVKNIGASGAVGSVSDSMPITFQLGGSYEVTKKVHTIIGMLSSDIMLNESPTINIGGEYIFNRIIFGRFGYQIGTSPNNLSAVKGLSFGMGGFYNNFNVDISWGSMSILGNLIQTTISYQFDLLPESSPGEEAETAAENKEDGTEKNDGAETIEGLD